MNADAPRSPRTPPTVEQAQGVLMACYGYDPSGALASLRRIASSQHLDLFDLAEAVVGAAASHAGSSERSALSPCEEVGLLMGDIHQS